VSSVTNRDAVNARKENKMRDWKIRHQNVGVAYAELENAAPKCNGWNHTFPFLAFSSPAFSSSKCRTGRPKCEKRKSMEHRKFLKV